MNENIHTYTHTHLYSFDDKYLSANYVGFDGETAVNIELTFITQN